jgi:DNA-directed RNA polymerase subunit RPC12/RpoP
MTSHTCSQCGTALVPENEACPQCGAPRAAKRQETDPIKLGCMVLFGIVGAILAWFYIIGRLVEIG